jgi:hypothetical protein
MERGHDVEGVWCSRDSSWMCWKFEGDQASFLRRSMTTPDEGTFRIEANTVFIQWESRMRLWEILEKTPSLMRMKNKENGDDLLLLKRDTLPKPGEKL